MGLNRAKKGLSEFYGGRLSPSEEQLRERLHERQARQYAALKSRDRRLYDRCIIVGEIAVINGGVSTAVAAQIESACVDLVCEALGLE